MRTLAGQSGSQPGIDRLPARGLPGRPYLSTDEAGWFNRVETLTPAMCGPNALFVGQLGDWTWDAVGAACGVNPYTAIDHDGEPVYLAFAYFRIRASQGYAVEDLTFGDRVHVRSRVLAAGGDSVITLHDVGSQPAPLRGPLEVEGFHDAPPSGILRAETYNRWIQRSSADNNHGLKPATPRGIRLEHLPLVPDQFTPRRVCSAVRQAGAFSSQADSCPGFSMDLRYQVDMTRDLNGVGLLYFASFFSIVDWGAGQLWRALGRNSASFLARRVQDRQLCYFANANADDVLDVKASMSTEPDGSEVVDVQIMLAEQLVAVAQQRSAAAS